MLYDINPFRTLTADISPIDFEVLCMEILKAYAVREKLNNFFIMHNQKSKAHDGIYQIDLIGEFTALGTKIKFIVECKKYTSPVERDDVCVLYAKQQSVGANKSILISTAGFQKGAVQYAREHGIALIQIVDKSIKYIQAFVKPNADILFAIMLLREQLPKYFALQWDCEADYPFDEIYPTEEMRKEAIEMVKEKLKNVRTDCNDNF